MIYTKHMYGKDSKERRKSISEEVRKISRQKAKTDSDSGNEKTIIPSKYKTYFYPKFQLVVTWHEDDVGNDNICGNGDFYLNTM